MTTPTTRLSLPVSPQVKPKRRGSGEDFAEAFWRRVDQSGGHEACWPWLASRFDTGYGCVWADGRAQKAHRLAWELTNGLLGPGGRVLHHCDNPPCCNPGHLFVGTMKDNTADMLAKGRGHRHGRAILTAEQIPSIRERYAAGATLKALGEEHNVSWVAIWKAVHRVTWAHVA